MIVRIIIILVCITFFINGCNSLISQYFGTHKLRTFDMEKAVKEGIGDSDFVSLDNAWLNGDFVFQASEYPNTPGVIIYPVLTAEQKEQRSKGERVKPAFIAWSADFHSPCVGENNCIEPRVAAVSGVVREVPKDRQVGIDKLDAKGYIGLEEAVFINHGEEPAPWYWNALMMLIPAIIAVGMEAIFNRKKVANDA
jgi:hypothetical protein